MKQIKVIFSIIATLIGAGFASGQEIYSFFYVYGIKGITGLLVCNTLLTFIIYKVFVILNSHNIENYRDFVEYIFGKYGFIVNIVVNLFLLITFFIMIAGFGAFFSQEAGINKYIGSGILSCICFFTFMTNSEGVLKVNSILIPILIFFIILIGFTNLNNLDKNSFSNLSKVSNSNISGWLLSSLLYMGYNSILLIPSLVTLKKHLNNKIESIVVAVFTCIIMLLLAISVFFMLAKIKIDISILEMPVIYVISRFYPLFLHIYAFIVLTSIYTTAISVGISFLENTTFIFKPSYPLFVIIMCITGFVVSGSGFSNLVTNLYPLFGYFGLVQIGLLLLQNANEDVGK